MTLTEQTTVATTAGIPAWGYDFLDAAVAVYDFLPGWLWPTAATLLLITSIVLRHRAANAIRAAGRAAADKSEEGDDEEYGPLFIAAVTVAALFWIAVLAGSFRSLVEFAQDTLDWHNGWEYLVPATLDGVAVAFGILAFLAIKRHRSPARAYRVVWASTIASASINFTHEAGGGTGSASGGAYLALLSVLGMAILHELLDLFGEGAALVARINPVFGLRWLTWPSSTACAWVAWRNYPPRPLPAHPSDEQMAWYGSINHAVDHLSKVRRAKRIDRYAVDLNAAGLPARWWERLAPWTRNRRLDAALIEQRDTAAAAHRQVEQVRAEMTADLRAQLADQAERHRRELANDTARMSAEREAAVATARANATTEALAAVSASHRSAPSTAHRSERVSAKRSPASESPPEWTAQQEQAFALRDNEGLTVKDIAQKVGAGESSVGRWFTQRKAAQAARPAVPTTPIPDPTPPVTAGTNGARVNTDRPSE